MELNWEKCCLWGPGLTPEALQALQGRAIPKVSREMYGPSTGLNELGVPVTYIYLGDHTFVNDFWSERVEMM